MKNILIIDDDPDAVAGTKLLLEEKRFGVSEAHTQRDAQDMLGKVAYDAVVLDLGLPKAKTADPWHDPALAENGVELLRLLLKGGFEPNGTARNIPVFIVTAFWNDREHMQAVADLGVKAVFKKPVMPVLVAETIRLELQQL